VLFVNPHYIERIVEVSRSENRLLLEMFIEQVTPPEYTVRFRREPGSIAFWDNRATIHHAPSDIDHLPFPRIRSVTDPVPAPALFYLPLHLAGRFSMNAQIPS
jgi:hypothetical protein